MDHGSNFENREQPPIAADAGLRVKSRPAAGELGEYGTSENNWRRQHGQDRTDGVLRASLERCVPTIVCRPNEAWYKSPRLSRFSASAQPVPRCIFGLTSSGDIDGSAINIDK